MNKLIFGIVVLLALGAIAIYAFPNVAKVAGLDSRVELDDSSASNDDETSSGDTSIKKIEKTSAEWKQMLTPMQYNVTREHGTERAFTGEYWDNKKAGTYTCVCCDLPLFPSDTKYKSGTGWPSFFDPIKAENIGSQEDRALLALRTEVHCKRCEAHLGHVFSDGPAPTGLRYCINSASLKFVEGEMLASDSESTDKEKDAAAE